MLGQVWLCRHCGFRPPMGVTPPTLCPNDGHPLLPDELLRRRSDDPLLGQLLAGRWAVCEPQSVDLPGQTYRALRLSDLAEVSLHAALPDELGADIDPERFEASAPAYAAFAGEGLVATLDSGLLPGGGVYLVSESLAGQRLAGLLAAARRALPWEIALASCEGFLAGLAEAHAQGIAHGSLRPARLLLQPQGGEARLRLIGLGYEQLLRPQQDERGERAPSKIRLEPKVAAYLSPEQIEELHPDPRSDVYAAACLIFHLIVGQPPYPGPGALQILSGHLGGRFPATGLTGRAPAPLADLLQRSAARDPLRRPQSAGELLSELRALLATARGARTLRVADFDPDLERLRGAAEAIPLTQRRPALTRAAAQAAAAEAAAVGAAAAEAAEATEAPEGEVSDTILMPSLPQSTPEPASAGEPPPTEGDERTVPLGSLLAQLSAQRGGPRAAPTGASPLPETQALPQSPPRAPAAGPQGEEKTSKAAPAEAPVRGITPPAVIVAAGAGAPAPRDPQRSEAATVALVAPSAAALSAATPPPAAVATVPNPGGAETCMLEALDPALLHLQREYEQAQLAAAEAEHREEQEAAVAASRQRRQRHTLIGLVILGLVLLAVATAILIHQLRAQAPEALELDPSLQGFLEGFERDEAPQEQDSDPAALRARLLQQLGALAERSFAAVQESRSQITAARRQLQGRQDPRLSSLAAELPAAAAELRRLRGEVLELKVALPQAPSEQLGGLAANARRLEGNLIELLARGRATSDELNEVAATVPQVAAPHRPAPRPSAAAAPASPAEPRAAPPEEPSTARLAAAAPATPEGESDEELLTRVLGQAESGPIAVAGLDCSCDPSRLAARAEGGEDLGGCELRACWKVPPGNARFSQVALDLSRYHFARKQFKQQLLALTRATSYGRYSQDPSVLFSLIAVAAKVGAFRQAIEAKDRFLYVKHLLPPEERARKVPETFRILGQAFEQRYYRLAEEDEDKADPALLHRAIDYLERYADLRPDDPAVAAKLTELRRLRAEHLAE